MLSYVKFMNEANPIFAGFIASILRNPLLHRRGIFRILSKKLRLVCSEGECALETEWAKRIVSSRDPLAELKQFPYFPSYESIVARELSLVRRENSNAKHLVFLGSGSLPLTAILMVKHYGWEATLVDIDPEVVALSRELIRVLGLSDLIQVECADAKLYRELGDADLVIVAALVGRDAKEESEIYENVAKRMSPSSLLLVRSTYGSRTLLYRPMCLAIDRYFRRIAEIHPHDEVLNSAVLLQPYV